jgi:hypothetical protein
MPQKIARIPLMSCRRDFILFQSDELSNRRGRGSNPCSASTPRFPQIDFNRLARSTNLKIKISRRKFALLLAIKLGLLEK